MAVTQTIVLRNREIDNGPGGSTFDRIDLYSGAPVGAVVAQTGTLIATFVFAGFPAAANAQTAMVIPADVAALVTATIGSFLMYKSTQSVGNTSVPGTNDHRLNGSVSQNGLGGDMIVDSISAIFNQPIHIASFVLIAPP